MDSRLEAYLIACLEQLAQGQPVEEILAAFPAETVAHLRPMLLTAARLRRLPLAYTVTAKAQSKERFLTQAAGLRSRQAVPVQSWLSGIWGNFKLATAVSFLLIFLVSGLIMLNAPKALPGDRLYGAKLVLENWRLAVSPDPAALESDLQAERRREALLLLAAGRSATVTFTGQLAGSEADHWLVSGVPVIITTDTVLSGPLSLGADVEVTGQTAAGHVWAQEIVIRQPGPPPALPTPSATIMPSPTTTSTLSPIATAVDKATLTPTAVVTPTPTITVAPSPTITVAPSPTATAVDNNNDNNNDNSNDNVNDNSNENQNDNDNGNDNNNNDDEDDEDDD